MALELVVSPEDTVATVKARVVLAEPNPFPDQKLLFDGRELSNDARLSDASIGDGSHVGLVTYACEKALVKQLGDLLKSGSQVRVEEVGLLYSLSHGVPIGHALKALGEGDLLLKTFLERHSKDFDVCDGLVKGAASQPDSGAAALQLLTLTILVTLNLPATTQRTEGLKISIGGRETVASLKKKAAQAARLPSMQGLSLALNGASLVDDAILADSGVMEAASLELVATWSEALLAQQLVALLLAQGPMSRVELDDAHCCRFGVSATDAVKMLGWGEKLQAFLSRQPALTCEKGCISPACVTPSLLSEAPPADNQAYRDLHAKLCPADFQDQVEEALGRLAALLRGDTFLNVAEVVLGGPAAAGMAIPGCVGAEFTLHLEGVLASNQEAWLPGLARSAASVLAETLCGREEVVAVLADGCGLRLDTKGILGEVRILLAPVYDSYTQALQILASVSGEAKATAAHAAFAAHRVRFSKRLPEGVKAVVQLLIWWREQQQWCSEQTRPSNMLLELVAAHAAVQQVPRNLHEAVEGAFSAMHRFEELHVNWPIAVRSYREGDLWAPLREQTPLVTHPANPCVNVAALDGFQPKQLVEYARSGSLF